MGKYTSLARTLRDKPEHAKSREDKGSSQNNTCVNITNIEKSIDSNPTDESSGSVTTLRHTTLTTLIPDEKDEIDEKAPVICIHNVDQEICAVCSGYVRWLIEDDARLSAARSNPETTRRRYQETIEGGRRHVEEC
jgi:hypothetical protein